MLRNCIEPKFENIPRKNQNGFRRNRSMISQILTVRQIPGVCGEKNSRQHCYSSISQRHLTPYTER